MGNGLVWISVMGNEKSFGLKYIICLRPKNLYLNKRLYLLMAN